MPRHVKATTIPKAETLYAVIERHPGADVAELAARVRAETHLDDADANDVRN